MQHLDDGILHALVDGEIPSAELAPLQAHLQACDACRARLTEARDEASAADRLVALIEVPAGGSAASRPGRGRGASPRRWMRPLGLAASVTLAAALGYAGGALRRPAGQAGVLPTEAMTRPRADTQATAAAPVPVVPPATDASRERMSVDTASPLRDADRRPAPEAAAEPAARPPADTAPRRGRLGGEPFRLEERVVTSAPDPKLAAQAANELRKTERDERSNRPDTARPAAAQAPAPQQAVAAEQAVGRLADQAGFARVAPGTPLTFVEAAARLGGRLRQIDGMVPARLEAAGAAVRLIYLVERGELVLEQQRVADTVVVTLTGPLSADSLAKLRARIR